MIVTLKTIFLFEALTIFFFPGPINCSRKKSAKADRGPKCFLTINFNSVAN